ncbi:MAG: aspartate/glutamate racemase family protein [Gammaproteobacteria bacterium]
MVHALHASIAPIEATFARMWPEAETVSLYDESLYVDFNKAGGVNQEIEERIEALLRFSAQSGAQAILFTGSLFGDSVEAARARLDIPVLTAYESMIEEAFAGPRGPKLGLLATAEGTLDRMQSDIARYASAGSYEYALEVNRVAGAIDALLWGDRTEHDELVVTAAAELARCDILMLAQFSMAPVADRIRKQLGKRVLTSPGTAVEKLMGIFSQ